MKIYADVDQKAMEFESVLKDARQIIFQNGKSIAYDIEPLGQGRFSLIKDNKSYMIHLVRKNEAYHVHIQGSHFAVRVEDERTRQVREMVKSSQSGPAELVIKAPIPGLVVKVNADEGQSVAKGEAILVLEAMKMENIIKSSCDCRVKKVSVKEKQAVQQGQELMRLISGDQ